MRAARRGSLLVAFYLLTSAATVHAECAWVVWSSRVARDWVIHGTYQNRGECLKQLEREFSDHALTASERASGNVRLNVIGSIVYHCLPDTVDPRGPKGKSMTETRPHLALPAPHELAPSGCGREKLEYP